MDEARKAEIKKNYEAFMTRLPSLLQTHRGKYALMHQGEIVQFFDTARDAFFAGQQLYGREPFSVQEVNDAPIDLGFFSRALHQG